MKRISLSNQHILVILFFTLLFSFLTLSACHTDEHISPELVLVKAGTFQMGDEIGDLWDGTRPLHTVNLTYDFLIGKNEITFSEYDYFCEQTGRDFAGDHGWGRDNQPVIYVSWRDDIAYCNWLSEAER